LKNLLDLKVTFFVIIFLNLTKSYVFSSNLLELGMKKWTQNCSIKITTQFIFVQVYVVDIISGATNEMLCQDFSKLMKTEFKISMMRKVKFFLGLQIK